MTKQLMGPSTLQEKVFDANAYYKVDYENW